MKIKKRGRAWPIFKKIKNVIVLFLWLAELDLDREVLGLIPAPSKLFQ